MDPVIFLDPALGNSKTTLRGWCAESLLDWLVDAPLGVLGHVEMGDALRRNLSQRCELVDGMFEVDPLEASAIDGAGEYWDWLQRAAKSYRRALQRALDAWPERSVAVIHPGLSWGCANAAAIAMRELGSRGRRLRHVALLYEGAGIDGDGRIFDPHRLLRSRVAMRAWRGVGKIDLFAPDQEHAEAYQRALRLPAPLLLHPPAASVCDKELEAASEFYTWLGSVVEPPALRPTPAALAKASRRISLPVERGADIVMFWKQNDSTLYGRRNDMVARYLASREDVRRVLVLDAPIDEARLSSMAGSRAPLAQHRWIAQRTLQKLAGGCDSGKVVHSLFVYPRDGFRPDEQEQPSAAFLEMYERFLRDEFALWDIDPARSVFWIYPRNFMLPSLLPKFSPARIVVDVVDDHRTWPGLSEAGKHRLSDNYRALLACSHLALANCEAVQASMTALGRAPVLVPNGCDAPLPVCLDDPGDALREHLAFAGKTLGFVGNLEAKIDIALLSRLAEAFPECRLVLVGSTHANPQVKSLLQHPNVRMPGVVPYDRLGAWLSKFDVGLIPHLRMPMTDAMHPLKAFVYLGNGVPVVTTAVANVQPVPHLMDVARDADAFVAAVARRLAAGPPAKAHVDAYRRAHGWATRLGPHLDALSLSALSRP